MTNDDELYTVLVELEKSLHKTNVRKSRDDLDRILHDQFMEIGASGRLFDKGSIIEILPTEGEVSIEGMNFKIRIMAPGVAQLTYLSVATRDGVKTKAMRSSIWKFEENVWKLLFHQGTRLNEGE